MSLAVGITPNIAITPLGYALSNYARPHLYLPMHGPTLGSDPSDRSYIDDKAGRVASNGGTELLSTVGQLPKTDAGAPPASIWSDKAGWFTHDGTTDSRYLERMGNTSGDAFPLQELLRADTGNGLLVAFWYTQPTTAYLDTRGFIFDCGSTFSTGSGLAIETGYGTDAELRVRYYSGGEKTAAPVAGSGLGASNHFAWYFNLDDATVTPFLDGVAGTEANLVTPVWTCQFETNIWLSLGSRATPAFQDGLNTGTAGDKNAAVSDLLIVKYLDDVAADIPAAIEALASAPRGDIPLGFSSV